MESIIAGDADRMWKRISSYLTRDELKEVKSKKDFQNLLRTKLPAGKRRKQKDLMVNLLFDIMRMYKKESFARDVKIMRKKVKFVKGRKIVTTSVDSIRVPFMWRKGTVYEDIWFEISQYLSDEELQSAKDVATLKKLLYKRVPKDYSYGRELVGKKAIDYSLSNLKNIAIPVLPKGGSLFKWKIKDSYIFKKFKEVI